MNQFHDIVRGLYGAGMLARFDADGMYAFDISVAGFWRSFWAMVLSVPLFLAALALPAIGTAGSRTEIRLVTDVASMLVAWLAFLGAMVFLCRFLKLTERFVGFAIAYNWSNVIATGVVLVAGLLSSLVVGTVAEPTILILSVIYVLAFTWFVIKTSLGTEGLTAFLLLVIGLAIEFLIDYGFGSLAAALAAP